MFFKRKKKKNNDYGKIVVGKDLKSSSSGFNRLRDNVLYLNADGNNKVIQVESAMAGEGKSTVACNLAVSLGLLNKKVVLVDLDFRRPTSHRLFDVSKENGVSEYMLNDVSVNSIIKMTDYKNVEIITRGEQIHNSSLVLVSEKFKALIQKLREKYDYVILDCPPVLQVSDYIHIAKIADGTLFVVAYAQTTKSQAAEAIKQLRNNGAEILGTVFTKYDWKKDKNFTSSNYAYYYNYSYESLEEEKDN